MSPVSLYASAEQTGKEENRDSKRPIAIPNKNNQKGRHAYTKIQNLLCKLDQMQYLEVDLLNMSSFRRFVISRSTAYSIFRSTIILPIVNMNICIRSGHISLPKTAWVTVQEPKPK